MRTYSSTTPRLAGLFWSDNNDGTGENHLGKMLMELRSSFKGPGIPAGADDVSEFTKQVQTA